MQHRQLRNLEEQIDSSRDAVESQGSNLHCLRRHTAVDTGVTITEPQQNYGVGLVPEDSDSEMLQAPYGFQCSP